METILISAVVIGTVFLIAWFWGAWLPKAKPRKKRHEVWKGFVLPPGWTDAVGLLEVARDQAENYRNGILEAGPDRDAAAFCLRAWNTLIRTGSLAYVQPGYESLDRPTKDRLCLTIQARAEQIVGEILAHNAMNQQRHFDVESL